MIPAAVAFALWALAPAICDAKSPARRRHSDPTSYATGAKPRAHRRHSEGDSPDSVHELSHRAPSDDDVAAPGYDSSSPWRPQYITAGDGSAFMIIEPKFEIDSEQSEATTFQDGGEDQISIVEVRADADTVVHHTVVPTVRLYLRGILSARAFSPKSGKTFLSRSVSPPCVCFYGSAKPPCVPQASLLVCLL
eukprot:Selendium_serpulae@DN10090_c0_g1_i1.p1